jgi:ectoine hydroxylase-related dioxygenase (phytanoyl-CoA dioxygenase family)
MDMATALAELGVTEATLDAETAERLDRDGYAPLPGILGATQLEAIRARLAELLAVEGDRAGLEVHQEAGTDRLADLVNKGEMFRPCFTDPRLLACMDHVLGDFKLSSLNFRAALPGQGHQNLHTDWGGPVEPGEYQVCNSIWLLDDFTESNGATRVVPGSHRARNVPRLALPDPAAPHPDEVLVTGLAGTVVVFNSHLWHGGTQNRSDRPRRALHSYFTRREHGQQLNQQKFIRPQTFAALSLGARFVLDVS